MLRCGNANGGESSSDLCTGKRAAGARLLIQASKGAAAEASEASEATCISNKKQKFSPKNRNHLGIACHIPPLKKAKKQGFFEG